MIRKITAIALSALLLTACHAEEKEEQVTGTVTEISLTEIITEDNFPEPEIDEEPQLIKLALYSPLSDNDKVVLDADLREELVRIAEEEIERSLSYEITHLSESPKDTYILSYSEDKFEAMVIPYERYTVGFLIYFPVFIKEDGQWICDSCETKRYYIYEYSMLYEILVLNLDKWNSILDGNVDKSAPSVIIGDEEYKPADTGMTLDEMRDFFDSNLSEEISEKYKKKYIDDAYGMLDGKLYRKCSEPEWILHEAQLDVFNLSGSSWREPMPNKQFPFEYHNWISVDFLNPNSGRIMPRYGFYLHVSRANEIFYYDKENEEPVFPIYDRYIKSELPILPKMEVTE